LSYLVFGRDRKNSSETNNNNDTTMTTYSAISSALAGQTRSISRGRSFNRAGFNATTPITVVAGTDAPELTGQPYLKTQFKNGAFQKTLYTPSTLAVTVGRQWLDRALGFVPSGEIGPFAMPSI
jgi:hypothetical protein